MFYYYKGKCLKVIDGDTINVEIDLGFKIYINKNVRLAYINACEMNSNDEGDRLIAKKAKEYLENKVLNKHVYLEVLSLDKYSRPVAVVKLLDHLNTDLSKDLLLRGFAVPYKA